MPQKDKPGYKRLAERAAEGNFELVEPLDYMILDLLEDEGTLMGGYYPLGTSVNSLNKKFKELTSEQVTSRLRTMSQQGLVISINTIGGRSSKRAWQRTTLGKSILEQWKANR